MENMRKQYLIYGFVAGVLYVAACGGLGPSLAEAVSNAIDLVFDNSTSSMTAENTQDAIDELDGITDVLKRKDITSLLVGTWTGTEYCIHCGLNGSGVETGITFTLNADMTASCITGEPQPALVKSTWIDDVCEHTVDWEATKGALIIHTHYDSYMWGNDVRPEENLIAAYPITYVDENSLELVIQDENQGMSVISLTKS